MSTQSVDTTGIIPEPDWVPITIITDRCGMSQSCIIDVVDEHCLSAYSDWLTEKWFVLRHDADLMCRRCWESSTDIRVS